MIVDNTFAASDNSLVEQLSHMIRYNIEEVVERGCRDNSKIIDFFEDSDVDFHTNVMFPHEHMYFEGLFAAMIHNNFAQFLYSRTLINDWTERAIASRGPGHRGEGHLSPIAPMELSMDKITEDFMRSCIFSIAEQYYRDESYETPLDKVSMTEAINNLEFNGSLFIHALDNLWVRDSREHGWTFYDRQHNGYLIATMRHDVRSLDDALAVLRVAVTEAVGNLHYRDKILSTAIYSTKCTLSDIAAKRHNYFWDRVLLHIHDCGIELRPVIDLAFWDAPDGFEHVDCFTVDAHDTSYNLYCND